MQKLWIFIPLSLLGFLSIFVTFIQLVVFLSSQNRRSYIGDYDGLKAVFVDIALLMLFALQHSGMASHWWKQKMVDLGLEVVQRSLYVLSTAAVLQVMIHYWQPACCHLWDVDTSDQPLLWLLFSAIHFLAWIVLYGSALVMDFSEMVGLKQVYYSSLQQDPPITLKSAKTQRLFQHMRHGGATSLLTVLWIHPTMSLSRLVLACLCTYYILCVFRADSNDSLYMGEMLRRKKGSLADKMK